MLKLTVIHREWWSLNGIFLHSQRSLQAYGSTDCGSVVFLMYQSVSPYYTVELPLPPGALVLNAFNYPWKFRAGYVFPHPGLIPQVLSMFIAECVTSQLRLLILVVPFWIEAP